MAAAAGAAVVMGAPAVAVVEAQSTDGSTAITGLVAEPGPGSITVSFDPVAGAVDYVILSDTPLGVLLTEGATTFEFSGLDPSRVYEFTVIPIGFPDPLERPSPRGPTPSR